MGGKLFSSKIMFELEHVFEHPKEVTWHLNSLYEALVERSIGHMSRYGICIIFMYVIIIISFES